MTDLLVDLVDVWALGSALLKHGSDETFDRVRVGRIRRDLKTHGFLVRWLGSEGMGRDGGGGGELTLY